MSSTHRIALGAALAMTLTGIALAQGGGTKAYPTVDRVEFVLECMQEERGKQEFLYKCACLIDEIAQTYTYDDFVEASTAARYQKPSRRTRRRVPRSAAGARNGKALSANPARRDEALQRAALSPNAHDCGGAAEPVRRYLSIVVLDGAETLIIVRAIQRGRP